MPSSAHLARGALLEQQPVRGVEQEDRERAVQQALRLRGVEAVGIALAGAACDRVSAVHQDALVPQQEVVLAPRACSTTLACLTAVCAQRRGSAPECAASASPVIGHMLAFANFAALVGSPSHEPARLPLARPVLVTAPLPLPLRSRSAPPAARATCRSARLPVLKGD